MSEARRVVRRRIKETTRSNSRQPRSLRHENSKKQSPPESRIPRGMEASARQTDGKRESRDAPARCPGCRASPIANGADREELHLCRTGGESEPARSLREPAPAYSLSLHV